MTGISRNRGSLLSRREDIIAADARHHQIEQDEIEGLFFDQGERAGAVLGLKHGMALTLQAAGQQVSIRRIVVHHQNPAGLYGREVRFLRRDRADRLEQALDHLRRCANLGDGGISSIRWRSIATGKRHQTIDPVEQQGCLSQELVEIGDERFRASVCRVLAQHFPVSLDRVNRRAQVVAQRPAILGQIRAAIGLVNGRGIEQAEYEAMEIPTGIEDALKIVGELPAVRPAPRRPSTSRHSP